MSALPMPKRAAEPTPSQLIIAGIPERFRDRTIENYVAREPGQHTAKRFAEAYAANFGEGDYRGRGALLCGNVGTGKTHLAVGIAKAVLARPGGNKVLYQSVQRAIRWVKETWNRNATTTESQAIAALAAPDLLVLDEVGVQFGSETERSILFDILNERYERRRSTIFISNLPADEVESFLGKRVYDRLREDGAELIQFGWESQRGR